MDGKQRRRRDAHGSRARRVYLEALSRMTPAQRLAKADELTEMSRAVFMEGLRHRFPGLSPDELHRLYLERLDKCHNKNY